MNPEDPNSEFSLLSRLRSFKYAGKGIFLFISTGGNVYIHLMAAILVISTGAYFSLKPVEWVCVIFAIGFVLVAEAFNTAIEYMADFVEPNHNTDIGKIKDIAAGAVLIAAITSVIIGVIIFRPYIIGLI